MNYKNILKSMIIIFSLLFISCGEDTKTETNEECNPACEAYETCNDKLVCTLLENRCKADTDCTDDFICNTDNNTCEEKTLTCNEDKTASDFKLPADTCGDLTQCNDSYSCADNQRCENLFIEGDTNGYTQPCCTEGLRGCKAEGEVCEDEFDCASGLCIGRNDDIKYCSKECDPDNNTCPTKVSECKDLYIMFACVEPAAK